MNIADSVTDLVGRTPLVRLNRLPPDGAATIWLKLESRNPARSVKDRPALGMVLAAEAAGLLRPGGLIVEPTSGNTGIGLCLVAAARNYRAIIIMPESSSQERVAVMRAYGAEVILTPAEEAMIGAIDKAREIVAEHPGAFMPQQFENPDNPSTHTRTTGPEIIEALGRVPDAFVAAAGTGGTITGTAKALKAADPSVWVAAVEPAASPVLAGGQPGLHGIWGIGPGFVPGVVEPALFDEIIGVEDEDAYDLARRLAREEGLLVGSSSGAAVWAALKVAARLGAGCEVVAIAPDAGDRYLSTELYREP